MPPPPPRMDELLVGAPLYTDGTVGVETGRVYVYRNAGVSTRDNLTHVCSAFAKSGDDSSAVLVVKTVTQSCYIDAIC